MKAQEPSTTRTKKEELEKLIAKSEETLEEIRKEIKNIDRKKMGWGNISQSLEELRTQEIENLLSLKSKLTWLKITKR